MIGVGTFKLSPKAKEYMNQVLESERLSYGPFTQKFERIFSAAHGCRYGVMSNSGTSSLMVALAALKSKYNWSDGDEVIVPAVTFVATSNIVIQNNMMPVFVDIEPTFYELDPTKIEEAITPKTRAIIPVHLFGSPCDMDPIIEIAKKHSLKIIEDSCESMFVNYKGRPVGSLGDIGCFSTYVAHILTTGVGGLGITNEPDLAVSMRSIVNHGRDSIYINIDDDKEKTKEEKEMIIKRRFSFVQMGYSFRITELEGALGVAEFENHEEMMKTRWNNGHFLKEKLAKFEDRIQLPTVRKDCGHSFMMFPIVVREEKKDKLVSYLEENDIETRDMLPLINQPYYKERFDIKEGDFPVADWVNRSGFYIASHHGLTETEKEYMVETFDRYFSHQRAFKNENCLVLVFKSFKTPDQLSLDLFLEKLSLKSFKEIVLLDQVGHESIHEYFRSKGFKVVRSNKHESFVQKIIDHVDSENIITMGLEKQEDTETIDSLIIKLKQGNDLVIGSRFMVGGERRTNNVLSYRSLGNRFFTFVLNIIFNKNISDSNNFFRGFKKSAMTKLELKENVDNAMFEMTLKSLEKDISLSEIPTIETVTNIETNKRNSFINAFYFFVILAKYIINPKSQGRRKRVYYG